MAECRNSIEDEKGILDTTNNKATGDEDDSRCCHCDVYRKHWKPGDEPWTDHAHTNTECPYIRSTQSLESIDQVATMTQTTAKRRMKMGQSGAKKRQKGSPQPHITKYFSKVKRGGKTLVNTPKTVTSFFRRRKWIDRNTNKGGQNIRKFSKSKFQQGAAIPHCTFKSDKNTDPSGPIPTSRSNSVTMPANLSATDPADNPKAAENIDEIVIAEPDITVKTKPKGVSSNTGTINGTVPNNNAAESGDNTIEAGGEVCNMTTFTLPQSNVADTQEACKINALTVPSNIIATQNEDGHNVSDAEDITLPYPIRNQRYAEANDRRETFQKWPLRADHDIELLVYAGFFYTRDEDIVRCFHCDIGVAEWSDDDDPWKEHARHSPDCPYLREKKGEEYVRHIQAEWSKIYSPRYPLLTEMDARCETFNFSWLSHGVTQSPKQMAAAGFFYTGEEDHVRCHYCDVGLEDWEPQDDPWVEHARENPFCKFLLKELEFIQAVIESGDSDTDDLEEEMLSSPAKEIGYITGHRTHMNWENRTRLGQIGILDINKTTDSMKNIMDKDEDDGTVDCKQTHGHNVNSELERMEDTASLDTHDVGDTDNVIIQSDLERMEDTASMDTHDVGDTDNMIIQNKAVETPTDDSDQIRGLDLSVETIRKENELLKKQTKCKMCCQNQVHLLFLPCRHFVACFSCGKKASKCIDCNVAVQTRLSIILV